MRQHRAAHLLAWLPFGWHCNVRCSARSVGCSVGCSVGRSVAHVTVSPHGERARLYQGLVHASCDARPGAGTAAESWLKARCSVAALCCCLVPFDRGWGAFGGKQFGSVYRHTYYIHLRLISHSLSVYLTAYAGRINTHT